MSTTKDKICNAIIVAGLIALVTGAGLREFAIFNGKLTSDLNANQHSITNLPDGFFPEETDPTVADWAKKPNRKPETDLTPATNYTDAAVAAATNGFRKVDGAARPLPSYLNFADFFDSYPADAEWYYSQPQDYGHCSSVRVGNTYSRNLDWKFDFATEFVIRMFAGEGRLASLGVANVGTNLTEEIVTLGKWSRYFKCLPGHTVDGINEKGVVCNINVVGGSPAWHTTGNLHPLAAVRWILDHATNAQHGAEYIAANIRFPSGWTQNFHYMIADETTTYIVEDGTAHKIISSPVAMTNFKIFEDGPRTGEGQERYDALMGGSNITSQWWTLTYTPGGYRASDLPGIDSNLVFAAWASKPRESHRGETFGDVAWWQTVHTSVYDITNRTLRIAVQERDDWYVFSVPQGGKVKSVNGRTGDVVLAGEDVISDLATIRSGAALGATAVQPAAISDMETKTHAAATYQPKGSYLTTESDPSVDGKINTHNSSTTAHSDIRTALAGKQATISDLATIRSGAAAGATAVQSLGPATNYTDQVSSDTRAIVTTWESFLDGSNVVFSITNYISGTYNLDAARLRIMELRDGSYHEVYNSRNEILLHLGAFETNTINPKIAQVETQLADKADKAWGRYTSTGGVAPSNTIYMTEPQTVFAGGLEYERVAVGQGAVCVLTTKGAPIYTQGDEGTFKFQDDGGTNYFGFAKTDSYTIGCNTDAIGVSGGLVTLTYNITMSGTPCVWYKADLSSATPWEQLNTPDGEPIAGASHVVQWEQNPDPDTEVCYINCGNQPSGFFKSTVEVAGDAKFMTNMPADFSGGILCTDGQHKVKIDWNNGNPRLIGVQ